MKVQNINIYNNQPLTNENQKQDQTGFGLKLKIGKKSKNKILELIEIGIEKQNITDGKFLEKAEITQRSEGILNRFLLIIGLWNKPENVQGRFEKSYKALCSVLESLEKSGDSKKIKRFVNKDALDVNKLKKEYNNSRLRPRSILRDNFNGIKEAINDVAFNEIAVKAHFNHKKLAEILDKSIFDTLLTEFYEFLSNSSDNLLLKMARKENRPLFCKAPFQEIEVG